MNNLLAFSLARQGRRNKNNFKIIDWVKVFQRIKDNNIQNAEVC